MEFRDRKAVLGIPPARARARKPIPLRSARPPVLAGSTFLALGSAQCGRPPSNGCASQDRSQPSPRSYLSGARNWNWEDTALGMSGTAQRNLSAKVADSRLKAIFLAFTAPRIFQVPTRLLAGVHPLGWLATSSPK